MPYRAEFGGLHFVYRRFDSSGHLLYIGMSSSVKVRYEFHKRKSAWFSQIAEWTFEEFDTRAAAVIAERVAIRAERPPYNRRGRSGPSITSQERLQ